MKRHWTVRLLFYAHIVLAIFFLGATGLFIWLYSSAKGPAASEDRRAFLISMFACFAFAIIYGLAAWMLRKSWLAGWVIACGIEFLVLYSFFTGAFYDSDNKQIELDLIGPAVFFILLLILLFLPAVRRQYFRLGDNSRIQKEAHT